MVFTSTDLTATLTSLEGLPEEITAPVVVKRLRYIVDYARVRELTAQTTMNEIVRGVTSIHTPAPATSSGIPNSPSQHRAQVVDKKAFPTGFGKV